MLKRGRGPLRAAGIPTKYFYTGVRVRDLERSVRFYRNELGMKVTRKGTMSHGGVWIELRSPGSPQRLEVNWYAPKSNFLAPNRSGGELDHLAFRLAQGAHACRQRVSKGARPEVT